MNDKNNTQGSTEKPLFEPDDVIHAYTRRQAFEDGVLIDLTPVANSVGFVIPVAITSAGWEACVCRSPDLGRPPTGIRELLMHLRHAIGIERTVKDTLHFLVEQSNEEFRKPRRIKLKAICHGDDERKACLTVMLPHED